MITLPNCPEYIVAFLAAQKIGGVVVNAGPIRGVDDLKELLCMTMPKVVVALDLQSTQLTQANETRNRHCWLWVSLKAYQGVIERLGYRWKLWQGRSNLAEQSCQATWPQLMEAAPSRPPTVQSDLDDLAVLQPTSGTTGAMKIAELTHRNLIANATQITAWLNLQAGQERIVVLLPMFHVYGLQTALIGPVFNAALMLPVTRFRVGELLELIGRHRPTVAPLVPAVIDAICDELDHCPDDSVKKVWRDMLVTSGAAPLGEQTARRFAQQTGVTIVEGYGLTEASPVTHINPLDDPRVGSIGLPLADTRMRLADLDNPHQEASDGTPGELWVSGPQIFRGYFDNPQQTQQVLHLEPDGSRWLRTGDLAMRDEDGFVRIVDRRKDVINCGGFKVFPGKVEQVIRQHAGVKDVAVYACEHEVQTEQVAAAVVPSASLTDDVIGPMETQLRELCREHLAPYEVPKVFEFMEKLPRSPLGKLLKRELRAAHGKAAGKQADEPHQPSEGET
jgi:long-chain acyl-CoA synthetase